MPMSPIPTVSRQAELCMKTEEFASPIRLAVSTILAHAFVSIARQKYVSSVPFKYADPPFTYNTVSNVGPSQRNAYGQPGEKQEREPHVK